MDYLVKTESILPSRLDAAPRYIKALFDVQQAEAKRGWRVPGRPAADTMWTFWLRGYDLDHIDQLQELSCNETSEQPEVADKSQPTWLDAVLNRFETLAVHPKDSNTTASVVEDEGTDEDPFTFMFVQPEPVSAGARAPSSAVSASSSASFNDTRPTTPGITEDGHMDDAVALARKDLFLRQFNYTDLPLVRPADRPLEALALDGDIWRFSRQERASFSQHIALKTKDELESDALAPLEKLVRQHEETRRAHEQTRNEVRVI